MFDDQDKTRVATVRRKTREHAASMSKLSTIYLDFQHLSLSTLTASIYMLRNPRTTITGTPSAATLSAPNAPNVLPAIGLLQVCQERGSEVQKLDVLCGFCIIHI